MMLCRGFFVAFLSVGLLGGAAFAQSSEEPLFKQVIADETKEQVEAEKARKARAAARAKRRAAAKAAREKRNAVRRPVAKPAPKLTQSEQSSVVKRFAKCYRAPRVLTRNKDPRVEIVVKLSKEGFLTSSPLLVRSNVGLEVSEVAYASARQALFSCQPYVLPVEKYDAWKEVNLILNQNTVELR